ncbi:MAG: AbiU2 domain-containing protein [Salipiger thiooxidans]|uniref:AbiU2 domain-containing protein n=1 Tax=Salipiger thiooxidans TaxID=282683 RepID=UPI001CFBBB63|nr:hypothetical protein [Salipiger thiooxidans]
MKSAPTRSSEARKIDEIVHELTRQLSAAVGDIGFLKATIDNELVELKLQHSFSGHALDVAIRAVLNNCLLFVTRSWEKNGSSIQQFVIRTKGMGKQIEAERRLRHKNFPDAYLEIGQVDEILEELELNCRNFVSQTSYLSATKYRTAKLAHLLDGKSDISRRLTKSGEDHSPINYRQLLDLAEMTARTICEIERIWLFSVRPIEDQISISEKYTRDFWSTLSVLRLVERER